MPDGRLSILQDLEVINEQTIYEYLNIPTDLEGIEHVFVFNRKIESSITEIEQQIETVAQRYGEHVFEALPTKVEQLEEIKDIKGLVDFVRDSHDILIVNGTDEIANIQQIVMIELLRKKALEIYYKPMVIRQVHNYIYYTVSNIDSFGLYMYLTSGDGIDHVKSFFRNFNELSQLGSLIFSSDSNLDKIEGIYEIADVIIHDFRNNNIILESDKFEDEESDNIGITSINVKEKVELVEEIGSILERYEKALDASFDFHSISHKGEHKSVSNLQFLRMLLTQTDDSILTHNVLASLSAYVSYMENSLMESGIDINFDTSVEEVFAKSFTKIPDVDIRVDESIDINMGLINSALSLFPPYFLRKLKSIAIVNEEHPFSGNGIKILGENLTKSSRKGNGIDSNVIVVYVGGDEVCSNAQIFRTLVHELAHTVHGSMPSVDLIEYRDIINSSNENPFGIRKNSIISSIYMDSELLIEDFTNTMTVFLLNPYLCEVELPNRYKFIKRFYQKYMPDSLYKELTIRLSKLEEIYYIYTTKGLEGISNYLMHNPKDGFLINGVLYVAEELKRIM